MQRHLIAVCTAMTLGGLPVTVAAQAPAPGGTTPSATASKRPATATRADALAALQDARATLDRLTEESMPQDAREALSRASTEFRAMYKAYTGEEPVGRKTALEAGQSTRQPDAEWTKSYDALAATIVRLIGPSTPPQGSAIGTGGSSASGRDDLTASVRQDIEALRQQLQRFHAAATLQSHGGRVK